MNTWIAKVGAVLLLQFALVGVAVGPQLSARAMGDDYLLRVEPVDPIDPFRGAYVDLGYPDLRRQLNSDSGGDGPLYIVLREENGVWVGDSRTRTRPDQGLYLACDDRLFRRSCGIESYFLPQDKAADFQDLVSSGNAVARVRIDGRGHAALIGVEER